MSQLFSYIIKDKGPTLGIGEVELETGSN